ncbi:hypothetical protein BLNAU_7833 [Blattamonas nauphoetae]|uniref:Uncharacterized protein n=1 Tax=Blattamonas nauphoetae TaxID=2049346 RepID=A0ABQ9Y0I6_9EUKA|nr:hypothetical protein BLNAU_7833 [Blattamonas nauphoetae]
MNSRRGESTLFESHSSPNPPSFLSDSLEALTDLYERINNVETLREQLNPNSILNSLLRQWKETRDDSLALRFCAAIQTAFPFIHDVEKMSSPQHLAEWDTCCQFLFTFCSSVFEIAVTHPMKVETLTTAGQFFPFIDFDSSHASTIKKVKFSLNPSNINECTFDNPNFHRFLKSLQIDIQLARVYPVRLFFLFKAYETNYLNQIVKILAQYSDPNFLQYVNITPIASLVKPIFSLFYFSTCYLAAFQPISVLWETILVLMNVGNLNESRQKTVSKLIKMSYYINKKLYPPQINGHVQVYIPQTLQSMISVGINSLKSPHFLFQEFGINIIHSLTFTIVKKRFPNEIVRCLVKNSASEVTAPPLSFEEIPVEILDQWLSQTQALNRMNDVRLPLAFSAKILSIYLAFSVINGYDWLCQQSTLLLGIIRDPLDYLLKQTTYPHLEPSLLFKFITVLPEHVLVAFSWQIAQSLDQTIKSSDSQSSESTSYAVRPFDLDATVSLRPHLSSFARLLFLTIIKSAINSTNHEHPIKDIFSALFQLCMDAMRDCHSYTSPPEHLVSHVKAHVKQRNFLLDTLTKPLKALVVDCLGETSVEQEKRDVFQNNLDLHFPISATLINSPRSLATVLKVILTQDSPAAATLSTECLLCVFHIISTHLPQPHQQHQTPPNLIRFPPPQTVPTQLLSPSATGISPHHSHFTLPPQTPDVTRFYADPPNRSVCPPTPPFAATTIVHPSLLQQSNFQTQPRTQPLPPPINTPTVFIPPPVSPGHPLSTSTHFTLPPPEPHPPLFNHNLQQVWAVFDTIKDLTQGLTLMINEIVQGPPPTTLFSLVLFLIKRWGEYHNQLRVWKMKDDDPDSFMISTRPYGQIYRAHLSLIATTLFVEVSNFPQDGTVDMAQPKFLLNAMWKACVCNAVTASERDYALSLFIVCLSLLATLLVDMHNTKMKMALTDLLNQSYSSVLAWLQTNPNVSVKFRHLIVYEWELFELWPKELIDFTPTSHPIQHQIVHDMFLTDALVRLIHSDDSNDSNVLDFLLSLLQGPRNSSEITFKRFSLTVKPKSF